MEYPGDESEPSAAGKAGNDLEQLQFGEQQSGRFSLLPGSSASIRELGPRHRKRIARHLLALDGHDRYLRFGYIASDEQIHHYVDGLNFERDDILGIHDRRLQLVAMAHLAYSVDRNLAACAEFGVSVLSAARGQGLGQQLFERALRHARNQGVEQLFIHALSENTPMLKIARKAGATVERDGAESRAYLRPGSSGSFWPACRRCAVACAPCGTSLRLDLRQAGGCGRLLSLWHCNHRADRATRRVRPSAWASS